MSYVTLLEASQIVHNETGIDITVLQLIRAASLQRLPLCVLLDVKCYSPTHRIRQEKIARELDPDYWCKRPMDSINEDDIVYAYGCFILPPRHVFAYQTKDTVRINTVWSLDGEDIYFPGVDKSRDELQIMMPHLSAFMAQIKAAKSASAVPPVPAAAPGGAPPEAKPVIKGVTTAQIVVAFGHLVSFKLDKAMTDKAVWTKDARVTSGTKGGKHKSLWNPVILATALRERNSAPMMKLNQAFNTHAFLFDWREEWNRFSTM